MEVLVTGASGFTGRAVVQHLLGQNLKVRGMVRTPEAARIVEQLGAEPVLADLVDKASLERAVAGVERIYHIAALFRQAGVPNSEYHRVNVEGTKDLLESAVRARVRTVLHCSTVGVHGHIENPPADENAPFHPGDPYQVSKAEGEKLFLDFIASGKLRGNVIRPAMIYGPGDERTLKLFKRIAERRFFYVGPGTSLVHFIDVRDLAKAFFLASERRDLNGEVFIIAGETSLPLNKLVQIIASLLGVPEPKVHLPVGPMQALGSLCEAICTPLGINPPLYRRRVDFFTKSRQFDCRKAKAMLGFESAKPLVEELIEIIASYEREGSISAGKARKPIAILRAFDGRIHAWDDVATSTYGWSREQAIGTSTHSLLRTEFPKDLRLINDQLKSSGVWTGQLLHRNKNGEEVPVESSWRLIPHRVDSEPLVLELNRPFPDSTSGWGQSTRSVAALAPSFIS